MKTENKVHDLFATPMNQFTNEELNILFGHTYDMFVYTNLKENKRYLVLDDEQNVPIDESRFLAYYVMKARVFYKETIKQNSRLELQREFKKLFNL